MTESKNVKRMYPADKIKKILESGPSGSSD